MTDQDKTKDELIEELVEMRQRVSALERAEIDRKETEQALQKANDRLELALKAGNCGLWEYNVQTGDALFSQQRAEMLGYSLEELKPHVTAWGKLVHPDDLPGVGKALNKHLLGRTPFYETQHRLRSKSGEWRWILARGRIVDFDEEGRPLHFVGTSVDITQRKEIENELVAKTENLERIFRLNPGVIYTAKPEVACGITFISDNVWTRFGYEPLEFLENPSLWASRIHAEDREQTFASMSVLFATGRHVHEYRFRCKDGSYRWVRNEMHLERDENGVPVEILGFWVDITDRKEAEQVLQKSKDELELKVLERTAELNKMNEDLLREIAEHRQAEEALRNQSEMERALLATIPVSVYLKDRDSVYVAVNKTMCERFGVPENELVGKNDHDIFEESDAHRIWRDDAEVMTTGKPRLNYEEKVSDRQGRVVWVSTSKAPFYNTSGEIAGLVGISVDITELKRTQELLLQSERYRAIADLAGGVAHNFNNLLQIVIGNLELARLDLEAGNHSALNESLENVLESCRFGAETVRRLQSFAGIRERSSLSEKGVFDLSGVVRQAVEMSKTWWKTVPEKQGITVALDMDLQDGCLVRGEKNELFEVVVNLTRNAVEALPEGGAINLQTRVEGSQVVLEVRDTGIGISEENLKRLFNPFFTTKTDAGSGLGLASSRKIIEDCEGKILVESSEGRGTTFTILLPLTQESSEEEGPQDGEVSSPGKRILVIDDMEAVLEVLKGGLSQSGHEVFTASSGQQGLEIFEEHPIEMVICDLGMPGLNGWEVGKGIKASCKERDIAKPPLILLTGWGGQLTAAERIAESGVDAVVEKPIDLHDLLRVVRELSEEVPSGLSTTKGEKKAEGCIR